MEESFFVSFIFYSFLQSHTSPLFFLIYNTGDSIYCWNGLRDDLKQNICFTLLRSQSTHKTFFPSTHAAATFRQWMNPSHREWNPLEHQPQIIPRIGKAFWGILFSSVGWCFSLGFQEQRLQLFTLQRKELFDQGKLSHYSLLVLSFCTERELMPDLSLTFYSNFLFYIPRLFYSV